MGSPLTLIVVEVARRRRNGETLLKYREVVRTVSEKFEQAG
jgi:hypothetical protein